MKFSIRDLFLVTLVVALGVGWWVEHRRLSRVVESQNVELQSLKMKEIERAAAKAEAAMDARMRTMLGISNPSAPAPNPPKP